MPDLFKNIIRRIGPQVAILRSANLSLTTKTTSRLKSIHLLAQQL
jgi:hypothetical protein